VVRLLRGTRDATPTHPTPAAPAAPATNPSGPSTPSGPSGPSGRRPKELVGSGRVLLEAGAPRSRMGVTKVVAMVQLGTTKVMGQCQCQLKQVWQWKWAMGYYAIGVYSLRVACFVLVYAFGDPGSHLNFFGKTWGNTTEQLMLSACLGNVQTKRRALNCAEVRLWVLVSSCQCNYWSAWNVMSGQSHLQMRNKIPQGSFIPQAIFSCRAVLSMSSFSFWSFRILLTIRESSEDLCCDGIYYDSLSLCIVYICC
jgi:hypothetical protein